MAYNINELSARIISKRYNKSTQNDTSFETPVNLRQAPSIQHKRTIEGDFDTGLFSFTTRGSIDIKPNDMFEFQSRGIKYSHWIIDITRRIKSPIKKKGAYVWEYTIQTIELTAMLTAYYLNIGFPRASKQAIAQREARDLSQIIGRCYLTTYIQKSTNALTEDNIFDYESISSLAHRFVIWESIEPNLLERLQKYTRTPQVYFNGWTIMEAFNYIFSLIGARPYIYKDENNKLVLSARYFSSSQTEAQIPEKHIVNIIENINTKGYATQAVSTVNNITSDTSEVQEIVNFTVSTNGAWTEQDAELELRHGIDYVKRLEILDTQNVSQGWVDITDAVDTQEYVNSRPEEEAKFLVYFTIGDNKISGFGDRFTESRTRQNMVWYNIWGRYGLNRTELSDRFLARITYNTQNAEEFIVSHRSDLTNVSNFSQTSIDLKARVVEYQAGLRNLQQQLNRGGNQTTEITTKFANGAEVYVAPLLSTYDDKIIIRIDETINPRMTEVHYTLASSFNHINERVNLAVEQRGSVYDLENAYTRHIIYDEFAIWDTVPHINFASEAGAYTSLTDQGVNSYSLTFSSQVQGQSILQAVLVAPGVIKYQGPNESGETDSGLLLGAQTANGLEYNQARLKMRNNIYAKWTTRYDEVQDRVIQVGVPYTETGGYLNKIGLTFGSDLLDESNRTVEELKAEPYITWPFLDENGNTNENYRRYLNSTLISMGNINASPTETPPQIDDWRQQTKSILSFDDLTPASQPSSAFTKTLKSFSAGSNIAPVEQYYEEVRGDFQGELRGFIDDIASTDSENIRSISHSIQLNLATLRDNLFNAYNGASLPGVSYTIGNTTVGNTRASRTIPFTADITSVSSDVYGKYRGSNSFVKIGTIVQPETDKNSSYIVSLLAQAQDEIITEIKVDFGYSVSFAGGHYKVSSRGTFPERDLLSSNGSVSKSGNRLQVAQTLTGSSSMEINNPRLGSSFGATDEFDLGKDSVSILDFGYNLNTLSNVPKEIIIGEGFTEFNNLFNNRKYNIKYYASPDKYEVYERSLRIGNEINLTHNIQNRGLEVDGGSTKYTQHTFEGIPNYARSISIAITYTDTSRNLYTGEDEEVENEILVLAINLPRRGQESYTAFTTYCSERPGVFMNWNPHTIRFQNKPPENIEPTLPQQDLPNGIEIPEYNDEPYNYYPTDEIFDEFETATTTANTVLSETKEIRIPYLINEANAVIEPYGVINSSLYASGRRVGFDSSFIDERTTVGGSRVILEENTNREIQDATFETKIGTAIYNYQTEQIEVDLTSTLTNQRRNIPDIISWTPVQARAQYALDFTIRTDNPTYINPNLRTTERVIQYASVERTEASTGTMYSAVLQGSKPDDKFYLKATITIGNTSRDIVFSSNGNSVNFTRINGIGVSLYLNDSPEFAQRNDIVVPNKQYYLHYEMPYADTLVKIDVESEILL